MDLGSAIRLLLRRWLVVLLGTLLTAGAAGYLYLNAEQRYQATGRMLLLLPADARGPDSVGSPFLYLPNGLNVIARIVSGAPQTHDFRQAMLDAGLTSTPLVGVDPSTPIITVSVEGTDPNDVIATRDWMLDALNEELYTLQVEEGTPVNQIAHTRIYGAEDVPLAMGGDWTRAVLGAVAAGGIVTLLAAFAIDRLLAVRKHKKGKRIRAAHEADDAGAPPSSEPKPDPALLEVVDVVSGSGSRGVDSNSP